MEELRRRIALLDELGLGYLNLSRPGRSLSGGELQRVQLVTALASGLSQVLYVLDEPSVGLHPRDSARLLRVLDRLKKAGNTVVMVEHDPSLMLAADHLIDLGPAAGAHGGQLVYAGPPASVVVASSGAFASSPRLASASWSLSVPPGLAGASVFWQAVHLSAAGSRWLTNCVETPF